MEKLVLRHDEAPAEVSLINYDEAMQIGPAATSLACTIQLAVTVVVDLNLNWVSNESLYYWNWYEFNMQHYDEIKSNIRGMVQI